VLVCLGTGVAADVVRHQFGERVHLPAQAIHLEDHRADEAIAAGVRLGDQVVAGLALRHHVDRPGDLRSAGAQRTQNVSRPSP